jgi:hypothetical protein
MTTYVSGARRRPKGYRVAPTSFLALEDLADELRPILPKYPGTDWKIDAGRVLEGTLQKKRFKFGFHVEDPVKLRHHAAFVWAGGRMVVLRQDVYDGLSVDSVFSRSTVVHEFSHIALDHPSTAQDGPIGAHEFYEDSEWQANSLMAAIMMPLDAVESCATLDELCSLCGTSLQASEIRAKNLVKKKLLDADHFNHKGGKNMRHK